MSSVARQELCDNPIGVGVDCRNSAPSIDPFLFPLTTPRVSANLFEQKNESHVRLLTLPR